MSHPWIEPLEYSPLPRKLEAFLKVLGEPSVPMSRSLLDHVRLMAATSNNGVVLIVGPSAPWIIPWVMDTLQPGTRAVALIEPGTEARIQALGALVQDDLRLALRVQESKSFLADMGDQKFCLIVDLDQAADLSAELAQIFSHGCLVRGGLAEEIDPREAIAIRFYDEFGGVIGQLVKPRPTALRRRGGRKTRLVGRKAGVQSPEELFKGAFQKDPSVVSP